MPRLRRIRLGADYFGGIGSLKTKEDWLVLAGTTAAASVACLAALTWPRVLPLIVGVFVLLGVAIKKPHAVSAVMVIAAIPMMRPNALGELYSPYALLLCVCAGFIALIADRGCLGMLRSYWVVTLMTALSYLWMLIITSIAGTSGAPFLVQGAAITILTLVSVGLVLADPKRRRIVLRGFVWMVMALCVSFVVTFAIWLVTGVGSLQIGSFTTYHAAEGKSALYFPFTPSFGFQTVGGVIFPRLTGLGREPGWMSLYCGLALLLWGRVGKPNIFGQFALIAGLLGAFSTAGFGGFVVALMVAWIVRKSKTKDMSVHFFGLLFKLAALGGGLWLAVYAPVFGFAVKGTMNAISLEDRSNATQAGLDTLADSPLLGSGEGQAINLIASIAPFGVILPLTVVAALLLPRLGHPDKRLTTAPILLLLITLLLSQPAGDSTFIYVMAGLIYACCLPDMGRDEDPAGSRRPQKGQGHQLPAAYKGLARKASRTMEPYMSQQGD